MFALNIVGIVVPFIWNTEDNVSCSMSFTIEDHFELIHRA